mmetsp:Transcript_90941/g.211596  ORF Transcript_90941/g.211596 Transcript_90941/m.211596 type:complete len:345 (+) Transcript_90941:77-1111(+)
MREGQARRIAALLLLCVSRAHGLRRVDAAEEEPRSGDNTLREWDPCHKKDQGQDMQHGDKTSVQEELQEALVAVREGEGSLYMDSQNKFVEQCLASKTCKGNVTELARRERRYSQERKDSQCGVRFIHRVALFLYTGPMYTKINECLRFPACAARTARRAISKEDCDADNKETYHLIRVLMGALQASPYLTMPLEHPSCSTEAPTAPPQPPPTEATKPVFLFRGSKRLMPILENNLEEGFEFQDESFMSATKNKTLAMTGFEGECSNSPNKWIMKIDCSRDRCASGRDISMFSKHQEEMEVVFPPGMPFKVHSVERGNPNYIIVAPLENANPGLSPPTTAQPTV